MTKSTEEAIATLNELIEICEDGEKGFHAAAEGVQNAQLKIVFEQYAAQRESFATELQQQVTSLGGDAKESGSAAGTLHRGWLNLKAAITGKDDHAILVECERGEDAAKEAYEKAVSGTALPGTILPMVEKQYTKVQEAHDQIKELRDREKLVA